MAAWQPIRFPPVQRKLGSRFDENAKVLIDSAVKAVNFTQLPMIRVCQILIEFGDWLIDGVHLAKNSFKFVFIWKP